MKHLKPEMYHKAVADAEKDIRAAHPEPTFGTYKSYRISDYPSWVTAILLTGLSLIWIGAMTISTAKLYEAASIAFRGGSGLDVALATASIFMFSEFGVIVFNLGTTIFTGATWQRLFRGLAVACGATAVISNGTILLLTFQPGVQVFQGWIAFFVPVLTVGIGLFLERLLAGYLTAHITAKNAFEAAHKFWREYNPKDDPEYLSALGRRVLDALTQWQGGPNSAARAEFQARRDDPENGHIFETETFRAEYEYQKRVFKVDAPAEAASQPSEPRPLAHSDRLMGLAGVVAQQSSQDTQS